MPSPHLSNSYGALLNGEEEVKSKREERVASMLKRMKSSEELEGDHSTAADYVYYVIYAIVNSIMCIPCLYGYAAVIFNNDAFSPHIDSLSKLVLWSSAVHQACFLIFSSLPFAVGQVQDAGLIFLSAMANTIANSLASEDASDEEIISTTLVLLSLATATLGLVLVVIGKLKFADAVSYLPLPVVGGYLAFIGYFCLEAGISLCISKPMVGILGWVELFHERAIILAIPGVVAGYAFTWISHNVENSSALPISMVVVLLMFYVILFGFGYEIEDARSYGWVGEKGPPVPVTDLFGLIDISKVHWALAGKCFATWVGMVFVVAFSSCLDIAAVSMDMGEPLDTNTELTTVGISNTLSGVTVGFTGSYIFSQTIFTCRTKTNSRWVGLLLMIAELAVLASTANILEIAPLYFLGSTLIFIGFDLMYEWIIEVRHKLLLSEYAILMATFLSIHFVGIDAGIILGFVVALGDYVVSTARVSSLARVEKRSRAVWRSEQRLMLENQGYNAENPRIVTLEIRGTVFFGSAVQLLRKITEETGMDVSEEDSKAVVAQSPLVHRGGARFNSSPVLGSKFRRSSRLRRPPRFIILDLTQVPNVDSTAAQTCFRQLGKICTRYRVVVFAAAANARVDWILRSHGVAVEPDKVEDITSSLSALTPPSGRELVAVDDRILIFETVSEALEVAESRLIEDLERVSRHALESAKVLATPDLIFRPTDRVSICDAFHNLIGSDWDDALFRPALEAAKGSLYDEIEYSPDQVIFEKESRADSFYVVLVGSVAMFRPDKVGTGSTRFKSGAGNVQKSNSSTSLAELGEVGTFLSRGAVFGYVESMLYRPARTFAAASTRNGATLAKFHIDKVLHLRTENPVLGRLLDMVLLQVSLHELGNVPDP